MPYLEIPLLLPSMPVIKGSTSFVSVHVIAGVLVLRPDLKKMNGISSDTL